MQECKSRSKEWEQEKRNLQRQIESAQMQNSTLSHKLELSQVSINLCSFQDYKRMFHIHTHTLFNFFSELKML